MTVIEDQGEIVEREIPGLGLLRFENQGPGQWTTKAGEPAKKARRRYLLNDEELSSVSDVVGVLNKWALTRRGGWIERETAIGAVMAYKTGELQGVYPGDYWDRIRSLGLGCGKADEGASRGTVIHDVMHTLAETGRAPNPASVPEIARPWVRAAVKAWRALNVVEVVERESMVCHPELGFAGRFDLLVMTKPEGTLLDEPVLTLVDYKTGAGRVFEEAHWQTRLYSMALERSLGLVAERILILGLADDGSFELIDCECREEDAEALARVRAARKRVNSGMSAQRRRKA